MVQPHAEPHPGAGEPWVRSRRFPIWQGAFHRCSRPQLASKGEDDQVVSTWSNAVCSKKRRRAEGPDQAEDPDGADAIAAAYADRTPGYRIEAHPADWTWYGRAAGCRRNAEMAALGADGCAAFIRGASPGSTQAVQLGSSAVFPRV
jgi:hypothetical protein